MYDAVRKNRNEIWLETGQNDVYRNSSIRGRKMTRKVSEDLRKSIRSRVSITYGKNKMIQNKDVPLNVTALGKKNRPEV